MKTTKEKADELVFEFRLHANMWDCYDDAPNEDKNDIQCAILSVKHTIEILNNVITHDKERYGITCRGATIELEEQTELLTELESRL